MSKRHFKGNTIYTEFFIYNSCPTKFLLLWLPCRLLKYTLIDRPALSHPHIPYNPENDLFKLTVLPYHFSFLHKNLQWLPTAVRLYTLSHRQCLTWMAPTCVSLLLTCLSPGLHRIPDILAFFLSFEQDKIFPTSRTLHYPSLRL